MVLAETRTQDRKGDLSNTTSIFLVDKSLPGITIHKKDNLIGLGKSYTSKVSFNNVTVTAGMLILDKSLSF